MPRMLFDLMMLCGGWPCLAPHTHALALGKEFQLHELDTTSCLQIGSQLLTPQRVATTQDLSWLWGIPLSLVGSTLVVCGLMIQKMAHIASEEQDQKEPSHSIFYCANIRWIGGLLLFLMGNTITWAALGMAPNSVLSCFNSWNIILTMVIAPMWFNEVVSSRTKICAFILVVGCCWVAIAGPRSYRLQTVTHLNTLFGHPAFLVSTVCLVLVYVAALIRYRYVRPDRIWNTMTIATIAVMASISASFAMIFSKCTSSLVQTSVVTKHSEVHHQFFIYGALALVCGLSQIHFLNESLKHGDASFVIPLYESMSIAIQIVVGGMLFQEYVQFSVWHHFCFWPGVCIVLGGIVVLTLFSTADKEEQKSLQAAEEEALGNPQTG